MLLHHNVLLASLMLFLGACGDDKDSSTGDSTTTPGTTTGTSTGEPTTEPVTTTEPTTDPGTTTADTSATTSEDTTDETGTAAVDYMADIQPIWDMRCVAGCHIETGIAQMGGPILTAQASYDELVDAPSSTVPEIVHVKPGDTNASYLWHKINGTQASVMGLGAKMPLGGMLTKADLAKIEQWIAGGAMP